MFIWKDTRKLCNPSAPYTDAQGTFHTKVPAELYEEIADDPQPEPTAGFTLDEEYYRAEDWSATQRPYIVWTRKSQEQLDAITAQKAKRQANLEARAENAENATIQYLTTHTAAQIATYVNNNVTDLASAKVVIARLAIAVGAMLRED